MSSIFEDMAVNPAEPRKLESFEYQTREGGDWTAIEAHNVYFHEGGKVGFWNDAEDREPTLTLATTAFAVREVLP